MPDNDIVVGGTGRIFPFISLFIAHEFFCCRQRGYGVYRHAPGAIFAFLFVIIYTCPGRGEAQEG